MTELVGFIVTTLTVGSLILVLFFISLILYQIYEWIDANRIIEKRLDKIFKAGEKE